MQRIDVNHENEMGPDVEGRYYYAHEVDALLAEYGIPMPKETMFQSAAKALAACDGHWTDTDLSAGEKMSKATAASWCVLVAAKYSQNWAVEEISEDDE